MVFATVLETSIPEITGQIVDTLFADERSSNNAFIYSLALFIVIGLSSLFALTSISASSWISNKVIMDLRVDMFSKLLTLPKKYFDKGDPYQCYCHKTSRLMKEKLPQVEIQTTFQSRFGPQEWLTPYTDKTLELLSSKGKKKILVIFKIISYFSNNYLESLKYKKRLHFNFSYSVLIYMIFRGIRIKHQLNIRQDSKTKLRN